MKHDTALRFWRAYIRMANNGKAQVSMPNPAIAFTARAHAGDFDEIPDDEYEGMSDDTEDLSSFWDGSRQEAAGNILLNAIADTELSEFAMGKIAGILADASVRTDYHMKGPGRGGNVPDSGPGFPDAGGMDGTDNSPGSIYSYLDRHIYGQEAAKRAVSMLMHHHLRGNSRNIVMAGPSGCGKTEIWRVLSKRHGFIRIVNGPQLCCDGWKGSYHLKDIFWDEPKETAEHLIIVLDEADKLFEPAITSGGTDAARMIQNELLKLMDGDTLTFVDSGNSSKKMAVDCRGVSVVLCGSFERMLQAKEEDSGGIGFCQPQRRESRIAECTEEDLIQYGNVRREVAARISRIVTLDAMDAGDFEAVMESPASPIRKIEEAYHVSLDVDADTRRKLASDAAASGLGCRYIRSMLLSMLDVQMFDNPDGKEFSLCLG